MKANYKNAKKLVAVNPYEKMTVYYTTANKTKSSEKNIDKIKFAHLISENGVDMNILDLTKKISQLVLTVKSANLLDV